MEIKVISGLLVVLMLSSCTFAVPVTKSDETSVTSRVDPSVRTDVSTIPIVKQVHQINEDGSYTFGYEAADGSFRVENRDVSGFTKGRYGYVDSNGKIQELEYVAGSSAVTGRSPVNVVSSPDSSSSSLPKQRTLDFQYSSVDDDKDGIPDVFPRDFQDPLRGSITGSGDPSTGLTSLTNPAKDESQQTVSSPAVTVDAPVPAAVVPSEPSRTALDGPLIGTPTNAPPVTNVQQELISSTQQSQVSSLVQQVVEQQPATINTLLLEPQQQANPRLSLAQPHFHHQHQVIDNQPASVILSPIQPNSVTYFTSDEQPFFIRTQYSGSGAVEQFIRQLQLSGNSAITF